jgi:hypothetical protein
MKDVINGALPTSSEDDREDYRSSSDSGEEGHEQQPLAKRRRTEGSHTLGLELVTAALQRGSRVLPPTAAADHVDAREEAEASLLQLEVDDLLQEARPDPATEPALLDLIQSLAATLTALPEAEVPWDGGAAAAIRGFLDDLAFQPLVSVPRCTPCCRHSCPHNCPPSPSCPARLPPGCALQVRRRPCGRSCPASDPRPRPSCAPQRPLAFRPPSRCQVVGSFGLRAAVRPSHCADLALLMPAACFDNKDQLNHRYLAKRALYLAHVAAALRGHPQLSGVAWGCLAHDPRRPVLLLHPRPGLSPSGFRIRLLPAAPLELCPLAKLGPARNNLRSAVATPQPSAQGAPAQPGTAAVDSQGAKAGGRGKAAHAGPAKQQQKAGGAAAAAGGAAAEPQLVPTPHYNTSVLQVGQRCLGPAACRLTELHGCTAVHWGHQGRGKDENCCASSHG